MPAQAGETITYTYDSLGRLKQVTRSGSVNNGASATYSYDAADNRTNVTTSAGIPTNCSGISFSISSNGAVTEGGTSTFTITKSGATSATCNVNYATSDGSAVAPGDYAATSGTLSFAAGQTSLQVSVNTVDDAAFESAETFTVNLSSPTSPATIGTGSATATVNDNDLPCGGVSFGVASNGPVNEGTNSVFTVTKSGSTGATCAVNYATSNGTAVSGSDYTATSGTLSFLASETQKTVSVATVSDTVAEPAETFSLGLSGQTSGAGLNPASATATMNASSAPNNPPVANQDTGSVGPCGIVTVNVIANDTDPDGNYPLSLVNIVSSTQGDAWVASSTSLSFQAWGSGTTGFVTYTVADSLGATATGTAVITVRTGRCP